MELWILSEESNSFVNKVKKLSLPGVQGRFQILSNHAPLISLLTKGKVVYQQNFGALHTLDIQSGCVQVMNNKINLLVFQNQF